MLVALDLRGTKVPGLKNNTNKEIHIDKNECQHIEPLQICQQVGQRNDHISKILGLICDYKHLQF